MGKSGTQIDRTKPSTACEPCRKLKSKCDRKRPACSQCIRKARVCTGYREHLDLFLRDERDKIQLRMEKKQVPPGSSSLARSIRETTTSSQEGTTRPWEATQVYILAPMPAQPNAVVATNFFFSSFAHGVYSDYLPGLYVEDKRSLILQSSIEAVSLSYLAKCRNSSDLGHEALRKHSLALQGTMRALSKQSTAAQDDTVASVMLLALFGAFESDPLEAARVWAKHINGAMVLVGQRPKDSFTNAKSQLLLSHIISSIQLNCLQREVSFPPEIQALYNLSAQSQDKFQIHFWKLIERIAAMREMAAQGKISSLVAINQASVLDEHTATLLSVIPKRKEDLPYRVAAAWHSQENRIKQAHNTLRMIRVRLNKLIVSHGKVHLTQLNNPDSPEHDRVRTSIATATITLNYIAAEICDSIPGFLCETKTSEEAFRTNVNLWICSFILPLTIALGSEVLSPELNWRIRQQLMRFSEISDNLNISRLASDAARGKASDLSASILYLC